MRPATDPAPGRATPTSCPSSALLTRPESLGATALISSLALRMESPVRAVDLNAGGAVLIANDWLAEARFPAPSLTLARRLYLPSARLVRLRAGVLQLPPVSATGWLINAEPPVSASTSTSTVALASPCTLAAVPDRVTAAASAAFRMLLPPGPSTGEMIVIAAERSSVSEPLPLALLPARSLTVAETLTVPSMGSEKLCGSRARLQLLLPLLLSGFTTWLLPFTLTTVVAASLLALLLSTMPAATSAALRLAALLIAPANWPANNGSRKRTAGAEPTANCKSTIGGVVSTVTVLLAEKGLPAASLPLTVTL